MLEPTTPATPASLRESETPAVTPSPVGPRSGRKKKRGLFHRSGIVAPALVVAVLLVVIVLIAARLVNTDGKGAAGLSQSIDSLGDSAQVAAIVHERETIVAMNAAAATLTVDSKPAMADPAKIQAAQAAQSAGDTSGGTGIQTTAPPADPTSAEQIGKAELRRLWFQRVDAVALPVRPVGAGERLERLRREPVVRRLRHPAVAAGRQDGVGRLRLADRPDHSDQMGSRVHQVDLRHALRCVAERIERRVLLNPRSAFLLNLLIWFP